MEEEKPPVVKEEINPVKKQKLVSRSIHDLLGGDYLSKEYVVKNLFFLVYLALLGMIYIANTYYAEKTFKDIERTKTELKELRFMYITAKGQLMFTGRYSEILKRSVPLGLQETTIPPYKIFYNQNDIKPLEDSTAEEE